MGKFVIPALIAVIVLGSGYLVYSFVVAPDLEEEQAGYTGRVSEKEDTSLYDGGLVYAVRVSDYDNRQDRLEVYSVEQDVSEADELLYKGEDIPWSSDGQAVMGEYVNAGQLLVASGNRLDILDLNDGALENVFSVDEEWVVISAVPSRDGKSIAYSLFMPEEVWTQPGRSRAPDQAWVYNLEEGTHRRIGEFGPTIYAVTRVLGWVDDNRILVADRGGEGGGTWGEVYVVNIESAEQRAITSPDRDTDHLGRLSPNGRRWAYSHCELSNRSVNVECDGGSEVIVVDLDTFSEKSVYKNLCCWNNTNRGALRNIGSLGWIDDNTLVLAMQHGLYTLDVNSGSLDEGEIVEIGFSRDVSVLYADSDTVVYFDGGSLPVGTVLLDLDTGKALHGFGYTGGFFRPR